MNATLYDGFIFGVGALIAYYGFELAIVIVVAVFTGVAKGIDEAIRSVGK